LAAYAVAVDRSHCDPEGLELAGEHGAADGGFGIVLASEGL